MLEAIRGSGDLAQLRSAWMLVEKHSTEEANADLMFGSEPSAKGLTTK